MNRTDREALAKRCIRMAEMLVGDSRTAAWPSKVQKGGLRKKMGLKTDTSLEEQTSASDVIKFFNSTDAEGRGMVMFAVNSNKDSAFWKAVANGIGKGKKSSERQAKKEFSKDLYNFWATMGVAHDFMDTVMDNLNAGKLDAAARDAKEVMDELVRMKKTWNKVYDELESISKGRRAMVAKKMAFSVPIKKVDAVKGALMAAGGKVKGGAGPMGKSKTHAGVYVEFDSGAASDIEAVRRKYRLEEMV